MSRDINLSGGEITILKTLGLTGVATPGTVLLERLNEMEAGEFIDTLDGLLVMGYVLSNRVNVRTIEDIQRSLFRVNSSYLRELREVIHPTRRAQREQRERRRRA